MADEAFGYPQSAVESFYKNAQDYLKSCRESRDRIGIHEYKYILSGDEQKTALKEFRSEYKFFWFLHGIALSRDEKLREKELEKFRYWRDLLKKYQII